MVIEYTSVFTYYKITFTVQMWKWVSFNNIQKWHYCVVRYDYNPKITQVGALEGTKTKLKHFLLG